jgi:hypothetical protein
MHSDIYYYQLSQRFCQGAKGEDRAWKLTIYG